MKKFKSLKDVLCKDLSHLYKVLLEQEKFDIALKVKHLQAQIGGFLITKQRKIPKLKELTDAEIEEFLLSCPS